MHTVTYAMIRRVKSSLATRIDLLPLRPRVTSDTCSDNDNEEHKISTSTNPNNETQYTYNVSPFEVNNFSLNCIP